MFKIERLARNVFAAIRASRERVLNYIDYHLSRMEASNPNGELDARIAKTIAVREQFFGKVSDKDDNVNIQKGKTDLVDAITGRMKNELSKRFEGVIRGVFGADSAEYKQFFPHGLTEYRTASRETMPVLVKRLAIAADRYKEDLPPAVFTSLTGYKTDWDLNRKQQRDQIALVETDINLSKEAQTAVNECLYINFHTLCIIYKGDEALIGSYFDQSILGERSRSTKEEYTGLVQSRSHLSVAKLSDATAELTLRNNGTETLQFSLNPRSDGYNAVDYTSVLPEETITLNADEMGDAKVNCYLNVYNPGELAGSYVVEVRE